MRTHAWPVVAACFLLLAGCGEEKTAEKASRENNTASRQEIELRLAHATETTGDSAGAEKMYLRVIASYPSTVQPHIELAEFYRRHNNAPKAIAAYSDALRHDPKNITLLRDMANTYINAGQTRQAVETLDEAIVINGRDPLLYNSKGVALDMQGQYTRAQQSYLTALDLDPGDAMTFDANLSMSYILSHQYAQAIRLLRPLLYNPDVTPTIRQNLAMAYGMKGEKENALKLGLKDLTPEQADENLKFYGMVSQTHAQTATPMDTSAIRSTIRDVFPEEDTAQNDHVSDAPAASPSRPYSADTTWHPPSGLIHNTQQEPALPVTAATLPMPVLRDGKENNAVKHPATNTGMTAGNVQAAPASEEIQLPMPVLKPQGGQ